MKKLKIFNTALFCTSLFFFLIYLNGCEEKLTTEPFFDEKDESISEFVQAKAKKDSFTRFNALIKKGDVEGTLTAYNPNGNGYTLFLPTDKAFDIFISENDNYESFQELLNDQAYVNSLVRYHVVNRGLNSNNFPYGALGDTTISGDLLTIGFSGGIDSTIYNINNYASVVRPNVELTNGYVHIIDRVLTPVVYDSYEWLKEHPDYSIFAKALEVTGLKDTFRMGNGNTNSGYPSNTMLVESDKIFKKNRINSIEDLQNEYSPQQDDYTSYNNGLYQFVAYHILEGTRFLNNFEGQNTNFNTYASLPISVHAKGIDIKINSGVENFDTVIVEQDTTIIDFIKIDYESSNVLTKNGAIHFIENVMELYNPRRTARTFQFYEEPLINEASKQANTYEFLDQEEFTVINWKGVEELEYVKSSGIPAWNNDYLEIEGDFVISYEVPKILPGKYIFQIRANADYYDNATIQVFLDGKRIGGNVDLTTGNNYENLNIGQVNFTQYVKHRVEIRTLIPGRFSWDNIRFLPVK